MAAGAPACFAFAVTVTAVAQGDPTKPTVVGTTNLPAGTELIISVIRRERGYNAQAQSVVQTNGTFSGGPFSEKGARLAPGVYQIKVLMPVSAGQPASVTSIIGDRGRNISGPLVRSGPAGLGKIVEFKTSLTVSGKARGLDDDKAKKQQKADEQAYFERSCYESVDAANRLVDEGKLRGPKLEGAQRQKKIEECLREMRK
jgi:hypothetical protein